MTNKDLQRVARRLSEDLKAGRVEAFESGLWTAASSELLRYLREQKVMTQGAAATNVQAARIVNICAQRILDVPAAAEYQRYLELVIQIGELREGLRAQIAVEGRDMPRISLRQLMSVAELTFSRGLTRAAQAQSRPSNSASVGENERSIHGLSGYANDLMFGVLRAMNEMSVGLGQRDLVRPDAIQKSIAPFRRATSLASHINDLEYVLDSASFGELSVAVHDRDNRLFDLEPVDLRLTMIRQLAIRRRLVHVITDLRNPRFVRDQLAAIQSAFLADAVDEYRARAGVHSGGAIALRALERQGTLLLNDLDAEDDMIYLSGRGDVRIPTLYHVSMALRWASMAGRFVAEALPGKARRAFEDDIRLEYILEGLPRSEERDAARLAWDDLTIALPARTHFELMRRPFVRTGDGSARAVRSADLGSWATVVRETVNKGGEVGKLFGEVWEEFTAFGFSDTSWKIAARNVSINDGGRKLTEIDLLLLRDDLLLVVELKALTGSGLSPYDHWKARMVVEKGCRQALLAADALRERPNLLNSIVGRGAASRIAVIQPLVLTSDEKFDGWSHLGVPVAGETIRKAITVGSKVEILDARTHAVVKARHHIRVEDLTTETILRALREPIELKIAPEQGAVEKTAVTVAGWTLLVPNPAVGPPSIPTEGSHHQTVESNI